MSEEFDTADYSFVVKRRGNPQKPWRWEIYCAGKSAPVERSPVFFESMAEAAKAGKKALGHVLANAFSLESRNQEIKMQANRMR